MVGRLNKDKCGRCGTKLTEKTFSHRMNKPPRIWYVCNDCYRKSVRKSINKYNWTHYITHRKNLSARYTAYKKLCLKLANYTCQRCGKKAERFELHHIDNNYKNNVVENLILLCLKCHRSIVHTKKYLKNNKLADFIK